MIPLKSNTILQYLLASTLLVKSVFATADTWDGSTSSLWATNTNWTTDPLVVPGSGDLATFNGAGNAFTTIDLGAGVTCGGLSLGGATSYTIGAGAAGAQTLTTAGTARHITVVAGSTTHTIDANLVLGVNTNIINNSSSLLSVNGGISGNASGRVMNLSGGGNVTFNGAFGASNISLRTTGAGTFTLAGSVTSTLTDLRGAAANSILDINGQTVTVSAQCDYSNGSILRVESGKITFSNSTGIRITTNNATNGVEVLGGTFVGNITSASTSNNYNFTLNGASAAAYLTGLTGSNVGNTTLTAGIFGANSGWTITRPITLNSATDGSGLFIKAANEADTAKNITLSGVISGTGGFTKTGGGKLTLNAANLYSGATVVNDGTLVLSGASDINASSGITLNGSLAKLVQISTTASTTPVTLTLGTLDGTTTLGNVSVADDAANYITNGNGASGALTVGDLALGGEATLDLKLSGSAALIATGTLSTTPANGLVTINANNTAWSSGLNNLVTFGTQSFNINDFSLGTVTGLGGRQIATGLQVNGSAIALDVTGDTPVWTGLNGALWVEYAQGSAVSATPSFALKTGLTAADYWAGDNVEFNDTYNLGAGNVAVTANTVTIHGGVFPTAASFNNSTLDYVVNTDDATGISSGSLIKSGSGKLTINTLNSYSGGTTVNAGTIEISDDANLGFASGGVSMNGATLHVTASSSTNRTFNLANANTFQVDAGANYSTSGIVANGASAGQIIKIGDGTLTLTGANTFTGSTSINAGVLSVNADAALGSAPVAPVGNQLSIDGGTLHISGNTTINANRGITIGSGGGILDIGSGTTTNLPAIVTGTGDLTVSSSGSGRLAIQNSSNNFIGNILIAGGGSAIFNVNNGDGPLGNSGNDITFTSSGVIQRSTSGTTTLNAGRTLTINSGNTGTLDVTTGALIVNGNIVGVGGNLKKTGSATATLAGINTYTGDTTVSAGTLTLAAGGSQSFEIGISGTNNKITGSGTVNLNGTLALNLTAAGTTVGDSWTLVNPTSKTYSGTFAVASTVGSFTNYSGNWVLAENGVTYLFSQSTGVLSVIPSTGYASWAAIHAGGQAVNLDFDSDGVENGIEYFMDAADGVTTNPSIESGAITWTNGGNIADTAYGTEYVVQTSPDLTTWTDVPAASLTTNTSGPGGALTFTLPTGPTRFFVRLAVTPN